MANELPRFNKGVFPSMLDSGTANKIRDRVQHLSEMKVAPAGAGKLVLTDGGAVLDLSGLSPLLEKLGQTQAAANQTTGGGTGVGASTTDLPFIITDATTTPGTPTINVVYGTVMDLEPTDIATDIELNDDDVTIIYLENTLDSPGNVTASAIQTTTGALPAHSAFTAIKRIGTVTTVGGVITLINQALYFSQGFKACDRDVADPTTTRGTYEFFVD